MKCARTLILLSICAAAGCSKSETPAATTAPSTCAYALASATQSAPSGGGTFAVSVTKSAGSCTWSASSDAAWLTFGGTSSGSDTATLTYTAQANSGAGARTATITAQWSGGSTQLAVTQAGTPAAAGCTYAVAPASLSPPVEGGPLSVTVTTAGTGCAWSVSADVSWLTLTSGGSGSATGTVAYSAAANPDAPVRAGTITVQWSGGSAKVAVTQAGVATCVYTLSPATQDVTSSGGSFTLGAIRNTPNGCSWNATTSTSWITLTGTTSGVGLAAITYSVAANTGSARTGEITVAWSGGSAQLVVRQAAPTTPLYNVSFALYDPGRQPVASTECQITSLTTQPTTCTLVATANLPTAMTYNWTVQYVYGFQRILLQNNASPTFSFQESCGQFSASPTGTPEPLSVQLTVTDAVGNTVTVSSGSGSQPALQMTFFTCGIR